MSNEARADDPEYMEVGGELTVELDMRMGCSSRPNRAFLPTQNQPLPTTALSSQ